MNKFLTKIATAFVGMAMAVGVGVAIELNSHASSAQAAPGASPMTSTFSSKSWGVSGGDTWVSDNDAFGTNAKGIQVTASLSGAGATSSETYSNISKISVNAATTASGVGDITIKVGTGSAQTICELNSNSTSADYDLDYETPVSGKVTFVVNCSTNSLYLKSITITYGGGSGGGILR